jgi:hypothetical protein
MQAAAQSRRGSVPRSSSFGLTNGFFPDGEALFIQFQLAFLEEPLKRVQQKNASSITCGIAAAQDVIFHSTCLNRISARNIRSSCSRRALAPGLSPINHLRGDRAPQLQGYCLKL